MDPKELAKFDQDTKLLIESFPGVWWGLYEECREKGFTQEQAMSLVLKFIEKPMEYRL